ncbi:MAG: hypothetical protein HXX16_18780 [Bacteroidales bacterium]|nr:hypothetical protein [Bacteroidales bacterium]
MDNYSFTPDTQMQSYPYTDDPKLDILRHEAQLVIQDVRDFSLPDDLVISVVNSASDFFGQPHPYIINADGTWEMANDTSTFNDDIIGFSRQQMMEMGIYGQDALSLVMTHECCHRALQNIGNIDPWEHELACDYFAGVRAAMQHIDSSNFENVLINTQGGEHHPVGSLRVDFVEHGKQMAQELIGDGIQPTFENCLELFNKHLSEECQTIQLHREAVIDMQSHIQKTDSDQLSFTGKYSGSEINKLKSDVETLEYELNYKNSDVGHHQRCVDLVDTPNGHKNGEYDYEVKQLNKAISDCDYTASRLKDAQERLNNAL